MLLRKGPRKASPTWSPTRCVAPPPHPSMWHLVHIFRIGSRWNCCMRNSSSSSNSSSGRCSSFVSVSFRLVSIRRENASDLQEVGLESAFTRILWINITANSLNNWLIDHFIDSSFYYQSIHKFSNSWIHWLIDESIKLCISIYMFICMYIRVISYAPP